MTIRLIKMTRGAATVVDQHVERGKPAEYGQEIVRRRSRLTAEQIPLKDLHLLDYGAGNGAQTVELLQHGCTIIACDVHAEDLERLKEYVSTHGVTSVMPWPRVS